MVNNSYILIVEDNADEALLAQMAFKRAQIPNKLVHVSDGQEALDFLFSNGNNPNKEFKSEPDLILLDLKLPLVSGLEVLKKIRSEHKTTRIPVIVLTSSTEDGDEAESYRLGANEYVHKPTGLFDFIEIIKKIKAKWLDAK